MMGQTFKKILDKCFDYPVKIKPICFYKQEDFDPTGEFRPRVAELPPTERSEYEVLLDTFTARLAQQRSRERDMSEREPRWRERRLLKQFPGWCEGALENLHTMYLLFNDQATGMICFDDFAAILENLGDRSDGDIRKQKFEAADTDEDGWITYNEFLPLVYNFSAEEGGGGALAQLCNDAAHNIEFISGLTLGEQLQYGFF